MGVQIVQIFPNGKTSFHVQWEVDASSASAGPFNWTLFRSGSPEGPWDVVAANLGDVFTYSDLGTLLRGMDKDLFYYVADPVKLLQSVPRSVMPGLPHKKFLIWRKMVNDERVLMKKGIGIPMTVLKRRHFGQRCTNCYEKKTGKVILKDCPVCFGTSFTGGYFAPVQILGHFKPSPVGTDKLAETAIPEVQTTNGYFLNYPVLKTGDIIVEKEVNWRWEVNTTQNTELLRNAVHQDITASRLGQANIVYTVPVL